MAQTSPSQRQHSFFMRCNLEPSTPLFAVAEPSVVKPDLSFRIAVDELLGAVGQAVVEIEQRISAEAALRVLRAVLAELEALIARDPGIKMAADDLSAAATAVALDRSGDPGRVDVRRRRLLKEANLRLRDRLAAAQPSQGTRRPGLN